MTSEHGKLDDTYTFRIPSVTKHMLQNLPDEERWDLNRRLLLEVAKKIHESKFDARLYLGECP